MHQVGEQKPDSSFLTKIAKESEWLTQVEQYLQLGKEIAHKVMSGRANCLVYCPQGSQSTPVLTSIA